MDESTRIQSVYAKRDRPERYTHQDEGHLFMLQELERRLMRLFKARALSLKDRDILEVGCGSGYWLRQFIQWGAAPGRLNGVDLLPDRIATAAIACPARVRLEVADATNLPFPSASFDVVAQFVMMSSVLDPWIKHAIAGEMMRVLRPGGVIVWHDFHVNNPRNPDVRGIGVQEIKSLFQGCRIELHRVSLAPPVTRFLAKYSWLGCYALERLMIGNTFYLALMTKEAS